MNRRSRARRISRLPAHMFSLHPITGNTQEAVLDPLDAQFTEHCRLCRPGSLSIHLLSDWISNSVVISIHFGDVDGAMWRIYVHRDLWSSTHLHRIADGISPLFEFHPLGWGSEAHNRLLHQWGGDHGVLVATLPGSHYNLFMWRRPQDIHLCDP